MTAVSSPRAAPTGATKLEAIQALVEADMGLVNRLIVARLDSPISLIPQLAGHLVAAGGKRVRPMLTLIAAQLCGYRGGRHVPLAAAVEFIHTATLLHDDVVDESGLRRGLATANAIWGNKPSVLVGDFLFSRAFQLMVEDGSLEVLAILANASAVIAEGEVAQLMTANDAETTEARYLEVITAKTATLFAAAAQIGAVVGERPRAEVEALRRYGENLGIAFQLIDDVLDYSAREVVLGKSIGDDFRDGKITLPVVLAFAARRCRGAPVLAPHARAGRAARGRSRACDRAPRAAWRARRQPGPRGRVQRGGAARPRALSADRGAAGDARPRGLLRRARLLSGKMPRSGRQQPAARQPIARSSRSDYIEGRFGSECSSAW